MIPTSAENERDEIGNMGESLKEETKCSD